MTDGPASFAPEFTFYIGSCCTCSGWSVDEIVAVTAEDVTQEDELPRAGLDNSYPRSFSQVLTVPVPMGRASLERIECDRECLQTVRLLGDGLVRTVDAVLGTAACCFSLSSQWFKSGVKVHGYSESADAVQGIIH